MCPPSPGLTATRSKAAASAGSMRIFMTALAPLGRAWELPMWISALASMTIGNFAALRQTNLKRMPAYSSIAHAGYVLVALRARSEAGVAGIHCATCAPECRLQASSRTTAAVVRTLCLAIVPSAILPQLSGDWLPTLPRLVAPPAGIPAARPESRAAIPLY
jgi:NADH:ubiquinone oxidoreductase subunit 2 (subunit N)